MSKQKYDKILKAVLKKIKPQKDKSIRLNKLSEKILKISSEEAKKYKARAIIAGSLPRDTWLIEKNEFDIFVIFPKNTDEKKLESFGLEIGKKIIKKAKGKWRINYAQHPYIIGNFNGIDVDIVPCCEINIGEKIVSAVDRTPLHVEYLNKNLPKNVTDDVRLLKQFLRASEIYGADAKTRGFSGYLCELLIIVYGSFLNLLESAYKWTPRTVLDKENYWNKKDYKNLNKKFKNDILIVIDPVDKDRNVASPVSPHAFYKLKKLSKKFLHKPDKKYFFKENVKPLTKNEFKKYLKNRGTELLCLMFKTPKTVPDILWPQLRKTEKRIENILKENEFFVLRSEPWSDEKNVSIILFEMQVNNLPRIDKKTGPWVFDEKNAVNFIKKHEKTAINGPFIEENLWAVEINRKFKTAKEKLIDSLKEKKNVLEAKGIPNYIADEISKKFIIYENNEIIRLMKNKEFSMFLRKYFEKEKLFI